MLAKALLLFTIVPLIEVWLLVRIGQQIGVISTVFLVAITGFVGVLLAKSQGLLTIYRLQTKLASGAFPTDELYNGACILVGGALLLTPGVLTDIFGISLLIPVTRSVWKRLFHRIISNMISTGKVKIFSHGNMGKSNFKSKNEDEYYDADFSASYEDEDSN